MTTKATCALLALLLTSVPLAAQPSFTDGSDPSAPSDLYGLSDFAPYYVGQTFIARATTLSKVSFWYAQGTRGEDAIGWQNWFFINEGTTKGDPINGDFLFSRGLRSGSSGRRDIGFGVPLQLEVGETYIFGVSTTDCDYGFPASACTPGTGAPVSTTPTGQSFLDATLEDAFSDGNLVNYDDGDVPGRDLRFELTYGVPEPASLSLIVLPVLLFGVASVRRRARRDASAHSIG